jgi:hypothetical protein
MDMKLGSKFLNSFRHSSLKGWLTWSLPAKFLCSGLVARKLMCWFLHFAVTLIWSDIRQIRLHRNRNSFLLYLVPPNGCRATQATHPTRKITRERALQWGSGGSEAEAYDWLKLFMCLWGLH